MRKRIFAAFVCLCMLMALVPSMAYANDTVYTGGLCEHHTQHDDACGYTEGTAEIPCSHEHNESCGGLTDPAACNHSHDEACCYVPATEGTPCTFVCEVCNAQDSGNPATPSDAQPEKCTCETLCTGEEINEDCPVCSVEGAELDKVCVGVAPMLPVMPLAVDAPTTLYVGETDIATGGYWKTTDDGKLEPGSESNYNVHYDGNGTLTLNNAKIQGRGYSGNPQPEDYGIYAAPTGNQSVSLTINLMGSNTVSGYCGICVETTTADNASLVIQPAENDPQGSLEAIGNKYNGITISSGSGNASLTINNAPVVAISKSPAPNSYHGVCIKTGNATAPALSLLVNGGSLTAQGESGYGIYFYMRYSTTDPSTSLTIQNNALVKATPSIVTSNNLSKPDTTAGSNSGGIVFDGNSGTVYGDVTLQEDLEIKSDETLTIPEGSSLNGNGKLTNNGTIIVEKGGALTGEPGGKVVYAPTIVTPPADKSVTEGETATFTVEATGTDLSYQWQKSTDNGNSWTNIDSANAAEYTTGKTTMDMNGYQYRCVVKNSIDEVTSNTATLTVQKAATPIEPKYVRYIVEHYKQNADGSYTLADTEQPIDEIGKTVTATPKTYEGYTYNPNAAGTVVSGTLKAISSPDDIVTLKLYYDITLYTVTVNGSYAQTTGAGSYAKDATVTIDAGTRSGYTFKGWTSEDGVTFANAGSKQTTFTMPDKAVTVTANWKKKSSGGSVFFWDLKFDTNGGSKINTVTEWEFSTIDLDEYVPEKEGYKFVGWYADKDLDKKIDEVYLTKDTTVYAKWEKIAEEVPEEPEETEETETISFKDVKESDWFYEAVSYAVENGLMSGMSEDIFAPNTPLTREMLAVVLYNVEGQPESTEANTFTDVKGDMWYTDAILWANENGIVAGYDNGAYGVGDLITREQFATILYRYAQFKGYDTTQGGMAVREFSDYENISDYARPAMAWAVNAGIMGGMDDGTLMPQGKATRAEAATMLMNFCENIVK